LFWPPTAASGIRWSPSRTSSVADVVAERDSPDLGKGTLTGIRLVHDTSSLLDGRSRDRTRPSSNHVIQQRDNTLPYGQGNLVWMKQRTTRADLRPVDSPYLTVDEAAAYCRRGRKTILNHHCLGNIRSMPGTRPPLFRREELDEWLSSRRQSRKK
jgi:hypothetical protein